MKDVVGKEQANWCPETRDQEVGPEENKECLTLDKSLNLLSCILFLKRKMKKLNYPIFKLL